MRLTRFGQNQSGVLYVFLVLIISILALVIFAFLFSTVVQNVQEDINPYLIEDNWISADHFNAFYLAATLLTNFWQYIIAIIVFGLLYWVVIYTQRKNAGGS